MSSLLLKIGMMHEYQSVLLFLNVCQKQQACLYPYVQLFTLTVPKPFWKLPDLKLISLIWCHIMKPSDSPRWLSRLTWLSYHLSALLKQAEKLVRDLDLSTQRENICIGVHVQDHSVRGVQMNHVNEGTRYKLWPRSIIPIIPAFKLKVGESGKPGMTGIIFSSLLPGNHKITSLKMDAWKCDWLWIFFLIMSMLIIRTFAAQLHQEWATDDLLITLACSVNTWLVSTCNSNMVAG